MTLRFILETLGYIATPGSEPPPLKIVKAAEKILDEHNRIVKDLEVDNKQLRKAIGKAVE